MTKQSLHSTQLNINKMLRLKMQKSSQASGKSNGLKTLDISKLKLSSTNTRLNIPEVIIADDEQAS
mgnify:CR=1 FL=1